MRSPFACPYGAFVPSTYTRTCILRALLPCDNNACDVYAVPRLAGCPNHLFRLPLRLIRYRCIDVTSFVPSTRAVVLPNAIEDKIVQSYISCVHRSSARRERSAPSQHGIALAISNYRMLRLWLDDSSALASRPGFAAGNWREILAPPALPAVHAMKLGAGIGLALYNINASTN